MTARVIDVTNRKGGVGKTTVAVHLAVGMAAIGYKVGLMDIDPQGHSGRWLGLPPRDGLYDLLIEKQPFSSVVSYVSLADYLPEDFTGGTPRSSLHVIQSDSKTHKIPALLDEHDGFAFIEATDAFAEQYGLDLIILDSNPTVGLFDGAVHLAVDGFLYVTECEALAFDGISKAVAEYRRFAQKRLRYTGRESRVIGIVPNKLRANTFLHRGNIEALGAEFPGLVWKPIIQRVIWAEASQVPETVFRYAPGGQEADDAWGLVAQLKGVLDAW